MAQVKLTASVASQEKLADGIYSMWIDAEPVASQAKAGQFVSVYSKDGAKLLPRPISLCEVDKEQGKIRLVYRWRALEPKNFPIISQEIPLIF